MTPQRIQRKRTKGWEMPEGAVYVGRPSRWGNPFAPMRIPGWATDSRQYAVHDYRSWLGGLTLTGAPATPPPGAAEIRAKLAGKDLACWCPESQPCHADVLLEIANT